MRLAIRSMSPWMRCNARGVKRLLMILRYFPVQGRVEVD